MILRLFGLLAVMVFILAANASADISLGGDSRFAAMGGAGLASTDAPATTAAINPAALGMMPKRLSLVFPGISFRVGGVSMSDIREWVDDVWDLSGDEAIEIAQKLGKRDTIFDVYASTGLVGSPISAVAEAEGRLKIEPNDTFKEFAETGVLPVDPSQMEAVVTTEAALMLPSVAVGFKVPHFASGRGDLWLGTRVRKVKGKYVSRTINWSGSTDPDNLFTTSNEPVQSESGIGADFGIIYRTPKPSGLSFGLAVTNLIKPGLGDIRQETIWGVGMAVHPNPKTLVVADIVNLTRAYDEGVKLRVGMEVKPVRFLALRVGHSGKSFTTGVGLFGIDVAFASETPLSISRTIRF